MLPPDRIPWQLTHGLRGFGPPGGFHHPQPSAPCEWAVALPGEVPACPACSQGPGAPAGLVSGACPRPAGASDVPPVFLHLAEAPLRASRRPGLTGLCPVRQGGCSASQGPLVFTSELVEGTRPRHGAVTREADSRCPGEPVISGLGKRPRGPSACGTEAPVPRSEPERPAGMHGPVHPQPGAAPSPSPGPAQVPPCPPCPVLPRLPLPSRRPPAPCASQLAARGLLVPQGRCLPTSASGLGVLAKSQAPRLNRGWADSSGFRESLSDTRVFLKFGEYLRTMESSRLLRLA